MELTQKTLKELLHYNQTTGAFTWRSSRGCVKANSAAKAINPVSGYATIKISKRIYMAHRLAWLYVYGYWPRHEIDHINGARTDNRISNLRDVPRLINMQNKRAYKNNKTKRPGVVWHKASGKWQAQIRINAKTVHLGLFDKFDLAVAAREGAEIKYGFHANHGKALTTIAKGG